MRTVLAFAAAGAIALGWSVDLLAQMPANGRANQLTGEERAAGWTLLFDGQTLTGWRAYTKADATGTRWRVEDGLLTVPATDGSDTRGVRDLITVETFARFELSFEWKISEGGNSGVKYFILEDMDAAIGHEYQIIDDERHSDARLGAERQTAAFYDVLPADNRPMRPAGTWNHSRVISNGSTVEHWLNGMRVLTYQLDSAPLRAAIVDSKFKDVARFGKLQNGHILLQDHGNAVWYRNIKVRRL